jgi:class 3 adenylate cyclase
MMSDGADDGVIRERLPDETLLVFLSDTHIGGTAGSDIFQSAAELTLLLEDLNRHHGPVELVLAGDFLDLQIRVGLHTGEIELRDGDIGGIAVHIAARVMAAARPREILASRTVHDLVVGSDIAMDDRGTQPLKGIEGAWQLYAARP